MTKSNDPWLAPINQSAPDELLLFFADLTYGQLCNALIYYSAQTLPSDADLIDYLKEEQPLINQESIHSGLFSKGEKNN